MKFCSKCGKELRDEAVICIHCGCSVETPKSKAAPDDAPSTGFALAGFFIPLLGLILYLVYHDDAPLKARSAGKGALIGFITGIVAGIIFGIIYGVLIFSILNSPMYY